MLYVGVEWEKNRARGREVGQFLKLDPSQPDNPVVWAYHDDLKDNIDAGVWATAALWRDLVIVPFQSGHVRAFERATGAVRWEVKLSGPTWSSPVIVDDVLIQGDCSGRLRAFELGNGAAAPPELWSVQLGGCIESTPAVWKGRIYVGSRGGYFHAIGDPG
jgi:outer membrane protein assembly factor BamB